MSEPTPESLQRKVADGARRMVALRFSGRLIGFASFSLMARLLVPADFGLLALASSIIGVIQLFGEAGIELALIQRRNLERDDYDTAWTINVLVGFGVAAVVSLSAAPLALLMGEPRVEGVLYWLAAASGLEGFSNIGTIDFRKFLDFKTEFYFRFLTRLMTAAVTIVLAFWWRDYWALVAGNIIGTAILVVLSYRLHPYRPRFSLRAIRGFAHFSQWMLIRNILNGLNDHLINLIVARQIKVDSLAFFTAGREIAGLATSEVQAPIRAALFSGYAALNKDLAELRRQYLGWTAMIVLITLPIPAGLVLVAPDLVRVLLGERWMPAAPLIEILALSEVLSSFASGTQFLFVAVGRPAISAKLAALRSLLLVPSVAIGASVGGASGAAWAMVLVAAVMFAINRPIVMRTLNITPSEMFAVAYRPIVATLAMMACVRSVSATAIPLREVTGPIAHLVSVIVLSALGYASSVLVLWVLTGRPSGAERRIFVLLSQTASRCSGSNS
jgi:O-antigen/teichoic acid export membrane protein